MEKKVEKNIGKNKAKLLQWLLPGLAALLIGIFLELLSAFGLLQSFIIPAPSSVFKAIFVNWREISPHLIETSWVCLLGFVMSIILSFFTSLLMDGIPIFRDILYPLIIGSQAIPVMVITPVIVLLLGFGLLPKLFVVVLVCYFPIVISLYEGFANVDRDMLMLMRSFKAGKWQIFKHLKFPAALPSFFSGIKISSTYCVMAAVIAEWQGSDKGLGIYLMRVRRSYAYDKMFASILIIVLLSLLLFLFIHLLQQRVVKWKK